MSKDQILDLYLAMAPFGGNLEGVRAASIAYFGKEPKRLSLAESALLVALPQSPESRRLDRYPDVAHAAWWMQKLAADAALVFPGAFSVCAAAADAVRAECCAAGPDHESLADTRTVARAADRATHFIVAKRSAPGSIASRRW